MEDKEILSGRGPASLRRSREQWTISRCTHTSNFPTQWDGSNQSAAKIDLSALRSTLSGLRLAHSRQSIGGGEMHVFLGRVIGTDGNFLGKVRDYENFRRRF